MVVNVSELVDDVKVAFPGLSVEMNLEEGFYEVKVIGDNGSISYFYPNDQAFFVKMYPSHEDYKNHVIEEVRQHLLSN